MAKEDLEKHDKPESIVTLALERFKRAEEFESDDRALAIDDLRFINGEQWPEKVKQDRDRDGRPSLTENRLPTFIDQVVGDQRQNRPRIKVRPIDSKGDPAVAAVFTGIIKNIENTSQADSVRDHSFEQAVSAGWGYYGLMTRYADEMSFDQEIYHRHIPNQFSVYDDPNAKLPDRSDRKWLLITDKISRAEFAKRYPDRDISDFKSGQGDLEWFGEHDVRIGEYWYIEPKKVKLVLLSNGDSIEADKFIEGQVDGATGEPITIVKKRTTEVNKVNSCIICGEGKPLEGPTEWPGKYIPFIYVGGKELNIEGKRVRRGLVRWAKDSQRMHNYWLTTTTEIIALQPKAPWVATVEQVEGHESKWSTANTVNLSYLPYNHIPGQPPPMRQSLNTFPQGADVMSQRAVDGMKATMGIYDASLGAQSNETSGKAIIARQRESDVATFAFIDNLFRAISLEGRMLVDLIPKIYDTEKIVRIINPDDSEKFVIVNRALTADETKTYGVDKKAREGTIYDLSVGKYDVVVETGPSYSTQRAEAADNLVAVIQAAPQLMQLAGDILFKNLDWPGAQEVASRLKKTLSPGLVEPEEGEEPPPPPQPSPQEQLEREKLMLEGKKLEVEMFKITTQGEEQDKRTKAIVLDTLSEVYGDMGMGGMTNA